VKRFH